MVKTKKAGAKAARPETTPAKREEKPEQRKEDLSDESSPEDRRRKLPGKADQQQGKTGISSDVIFIDVDTVVIDVDPSSSGRHTAYVKGVNNNITDLVRKHEIKFGKDINSSIGDIDNYCLSARRVHQD